MKRMRLLVAMLIIWLFLFYNIERLSRPVDIAGPAYTFVPLMAVLTMLVPGFRKLPLWVLLGVPIPIYLAIKAWTPHDVWGAALPLTVTEICVIAITTLLARWVDSGVGEFESAIARITIGQIDSLPESFATGQAAMYREMRRARHHQRPLALMAIGVDEESIQIALDRMVQEAQQAMIKRYVLSDVARTLCDELEDYNIVAQSSDHFLVLLPEVTSEQLDDLSGRLHSALSERLGVALQIGSASFPEDAVTFKTLVEKAVVEMDEGLKPAPSPGPQRISTSVT